MASPYVPTPICAAHRWTGATGVALEIGNSGCRLQREKGAAAGGPLLYDKQVEQHG
jgi:hypothetical protein